MSRGDKMIPQNDKFHHIEEKLTDMIEEVKNLNPDYIVL